jgi:hypothetical protein
MSKKTIGVVASLVTALSMVATTAFGLTAGDISMLLNAGIINASQAASLSASIAAPVSTSGYTFATDLTIGAKGADVTALQQILVNSGHLVMPAGVAYGYFGSLTKAAVIKYQLAKGITPAVGYFGPKTRASISSTTGTTGGVVISGTDLSVSLAATSPLASALIAGQSAADLAEFTFTNKSAAPAVVTNMTLQRMGVSADTSLTNVYLYSGAIRLTDSASVSSGKITFNAAGGIFTVPAGSSMTVSVKADIASDANGQLVAIALTGVTASIPVSAVYPVSGASMSVFTSTDIAKATSTISGSVTGNSNIVAGSLNQTVWATSLDLSGRAVYLKSLALKVIGSIPTNSLQNVKLFVAGIQVASATGMDASGMITFDLTSAPYKIDSSRTLEVRADIVNGSSRTFSVSIQNASDIQLIDSNYNVGILVNTAVATTGTFTISLGSVTVQQDTSLAAGDVVTGATSVALARYTMKAYGEDMKISYLQASSTDQLDNVSLYANGIQIGSTQTISATTSAGASAAKLFSLGSSLIIPAGQTVTVEIRGDIKYGGINSTTTSNSIIVSLAGYANNAQGSYSSQLSTVPVVAGIEGPSMRVVGAGLTVAKNAAVSNSSAVPNTTNVRIGSYTLQANSSEAVRVTNLTINLGGDIVATSSLSNLYVKANGVASIPVSPQATNNNFSVDFTIPASGSTLVEVFADVSNTTGTASSSLIINGYGVGSNITITSTSVVGQTVTVGAGSLAVPTKANTSPDAQLVVGTSVSKIVDYNFVSTNGASTISEMYFDVQGPIVNITVNGKTFPVVSGSSTANGLAISIPVGYGGTNVPVTATYASIGLDGEASGQTAAVRLAGYKYTSGNNTTSTTTLAVDSNGMKVVASKPTVTVSNPTTQLVASGGTVIVARVTVSADAKGDIGLISLPIKVLTSATASSTGIGGVNQVKIGSSIIATTGGISTAAANATATGTIAFTGANGYVIAAGTSVTFDIWGNVTLPATTDSIQSSIASSTVGFVWADISGNATSTGAFIYNFPTNTALIYNQ